MYDNSNENREVYESGSLSVPECVPLEPPVIPSSTEPSPPTFSLSPGEPEQATPNCFLRDVSDEERQAVNTLIKLAESITVAMNNAWEKRAALRQTVAEMVCPWKVGDVLLLGDGRGPMDRRVVTEVSGGRTEECEYYKVKTRIMTKGMRPGMREVKLKLQPDLRVQVVGRFEGVMPEKEEGKGVREV